MEALIISIGVVTFALCAAIIIFGIVVQKSSKKFKEEEFVPLVKEAFPGWNYEAEGGFSFEEYKQIGCLNWPTGFDLGTINYKTADSVNGTTESGVKFRFCEVSLTETKTRINAKGQTQQYVVTYFSGGIFEYNHSRTIENDTYIRDANVGTGSFFRPANMSSHNKCETDSVEFNKSFRVYSNNPEDVFYFLTPQMMERMIQLKNKYKSLIIALRSNKIYVIIPGLNLFKTPIMHSKKAIDKYIDRAKADLNYFCEIPEEFDIK